MLAAGKLRGIALLVGRQMDEIEQLVHPRRHPETIDLPRLEPVRDVARDRQVRKQRVRLEDDAVIPLARRERRHVAPAHADDTDVLSLEPRDDPEQGGLSTAARPEKAHELPVPHGERDIPERDDGSKLLGNADELDRGRSGSRSHQQESVRGTKVSGPGVRCERGCVGPRSRRHPAVGRCRRRLPTSALTPHARGYCPYRFDHSARMRSRFLADQSKSFGKTTLPMSFGSPSGTGKPATATAAKYFE